MKQKPITLRKFVETFNVAPFNKISEPLPKIKELDWRLQFAALLKTNVETRIALSVCKDKIYYIRQHYTYKRVGNRIFRTPWGKKQSIFISPKEIGFGTYTDGAFVVEFLDAIGIKSCIGLPIPLLTQYLVKPTMLRAILTKRVYSEETFYRFIATRFYRIKDVSWRSMKRYYLYLDKAHFVRTCSLPDLAAFTKNINDSINVLYNGAYTHGFEEASLDDYHDLLSYAAKLGEVVDFTWSKKRIREEHQRQIEEYSVFSLSSKSQTPIYKDVVEGENIKLINTEKDVYIEGSKMHHCLYTCYYDDMVAGRYMAFHMSSPEDCTFSIRFYKDKIKFDQIHLKYNNPVKESTKEIALKFITDNTDKLISAFKGNQKESHEDLEDDLHFIDELF